MEEKQMSNIGIKNKVLFPENERFISPNRDLGIIGYDIIKAAVNSAVELGGTPEEVGQAAISLGEYCNSCLTDHRKLVELLAELNEKLVRIPEKERNLVYRSLAEAMLFVFGISQRESTDSKVMSLEDLRRCVSQGLVLARLNTEMREKVSRELKIEQEYIKELDRIPLRFRERVDRGTKEPAGADAPTGPISDLGAADAGKDS